MYQYKYSRYSLLLAEKKKMHFLISHLTWKVSVASTEQASSADNISTEEMASNMTRVRPHATDLSAINNSTHHINMGEFRLQPYELLT